MCDNNVAAHSTMHDSTGNYIHKDASQTHMILVYCQFDHNFSIFGFSIENERRHVCT